TRRGKLIAELYNCHPLVTAGCGRASSHPSGDPLVLSTSLVVGYGRGQVVAPAAPHRGGKRTGGVLRLPRRARPPVGAGQLRVEPGRGGHPARHVPGLVVPRGPEGPRPDPGPLRRGAGGGWNGPGGGLPRREAHRSPREPAAATGARGSATDRGGDRQGLDTG